MDFETLQKVEYSEAKFMRLLSGYGKNSLCGELEILLKCFLEK